MFQTIMQHWAAGTTGALDIPERSGTRPEIVSVWSAMTAGNGTKHSVLLSTGSIGSSASMVSC